MNSSGDTRGVATTSQVGFDGVQGNVAPQAAYAGEGVDARTQKPKGRDLTEDPDMSGKRVFGEVGTKQDPGRVAELEFEKRAAGVSGGGDRGRGGDDGESGFGVLDREERT